MSFSQLLVGADVVYDKLLRRAEKGCPFSGRLAVVSLRCKVHGGFSVDIAGS